MASLQEIQSRIESVTADKSACQIHIAGLRNDVTRLKDELEEKSSSLLEKEGTLKSLTEELEKLLEMQQVEQVNEVIYSLTEDGFKKFADYLTEYARHHESVFFDDLSGIVDTRDNLITIRTRDDLAMLYTRFVTNKRNKKNVIGFESGGSYTSIEDWCEFTGISLKMRKFVFTTLIYRALALYCEKKGKDVFSHIQEITSRTGRSSSCCLVLRNKLDTSQPDVYTVKLSEADMVQKALFYENDEYQILICELCNTYTTLIQDILGGMSDKLLAEVFGDFKIVMKEGWQCGS